MCVVARRREAYLSSIKSSTASSTVERGSASFASPRFGGAPAPLGGVCTAGSGATELRRLAAFRLSIACGDTFLLTSASEG